MLYAMLRKLQESFANQAVFLGPVVGGGLVAGSTMHLPLICYCGRTEVLLAAAQWTSHCRWPAAALRAAGRAEWPPAFLQQAFGCGRTGDSHHSRFEVAAQPALSGSRHSRWDNLVWNCLCKKSKSGSSIVILIDEWSCKDMQHRCWFLNKFDQEHLLWQCNSLQVTW